MKIDTQWIQLAIFIGTFLPLVIAFVQQQQWPSWVRTAVGVAISLITAFITALAEHKLTLSNWAQSALVILVLAKATYIHIWKPSGVAPIIESVTSGRHPSGAAHRTQHKAHS